MLCAKFQLKVFDSVTKNINKPPKFEINVSNIENVSTSPSNTSLKMWYFYLFFYFNGLRIYLIRLFNYWFVFHHNNSKTIILSEIKFKLVFVVLKKSPLFKIHSYLLTPGISSRTLT